MSIQDQEKWDKKFSEKAELLKPREASAYLKKLELQGKGKIALDLACGAGRHTLYLAKQGFKVYALDISKVALEAVDVLVEKEGVDKQVSTAHSDLDSFAPEMEIYDFIIMSNFLDRGLIQRACAGLKKGGLFFIETYMDDALNEKKDSNPDFLLQKGELKTFFTKEASSSDENYEIVLYDEFDNELYELYKMKKQVIVVRKL